MADNNNSNDIGYGRPPKHTQFVKGQSGNPKGRPRGSQNIATLLEEVGRERVIVTANGKTKSITKSKANVTQLANKAAAGDIKAIDRYLHWSNALANPGQIALPPPVTNENDAAVMASITERIRQSERLASENAVNPPAADPTPEEE